jgi:hypothetical protein
VGGRTTGADAPVPVGSHFGRILHRFNPTPGP